MAGPAGLAGLVTPVLLVDEQIMDANIARMGTRLAAAGLTAWPHAKTHKSAPIGHRQLAAGATGLTVATIDEAEYFADAGVTKLLLAYPMVGPWRETAVAALAARVDLRVAVDHPKAVSAVRAAAARAGRPIEVLWEIDCGAARLGTEPGRPTAEAVTAADWDAFAPFAGLMTFPGHAYQARDDEHLAEIARQEIAALQVTAQALAATGLAVPEFSIGSTPTLRHPHRPADGARWQARPGVYVFNDATQVVLGAATLDDCALTVAATVIGHPQPDRIILDAGSKALGADRSSPRLPGFGIIRNHPELTVKGLYEQHAIVVGDRAIDLQIGDRVEVIPNHACAAVNLHPVLRSRRGGPDLPIGPRGPG